MTRIYIFIIISLLPLGLSSQEDSTNYVTEQVMLDGSGSNYIANTQYYDGLGRASLTETAYQRSGYNKIHERTEYDEAGRIGRQWIPTPQKGFNGSPSDSLPNNPILRYNAAPSVFQPFFHDSRTYSDIRYDALGREVFRSTPGEAWDGRGVSTGYITNSAGSVKLYRYNNTRKCLAASSYYPAGYLSGERRTDEDGHTIEVYKDLSGNVVLERRDTNNDTYYVYEGGLLMYVLPPMYHSNCNAAGLANYAYCYQYDDYGRCCYKKLPGCGPVRYKYDKYGHLAFMQDSLMSSRQEWRFFLYDGLGRLAVQGICTGWGSDAEIRSPWTSFQTGQSGILNTGYSTPYGISNPTLEVANYYDGYQFLGAGVFAAGRTQLDAGAGSRSACVTTLQTAQVVSVGTGLPVLRVMYYDEKGRVTECREKGTDGYMTTSNTSYSFTDKPLQCTTRVYRNGVLQDSICRTCTYGQATDMLTGVQLSVNGNSPVTVASYSYDALGRMTSCSMGDGTATTSLSYDLHGWITQKKTLRSNGGNLFEENLYYADGGGTPCYNGNISSVAYKSAGSAQYLGHRYLYDGLDRLISAKYYMGNPGILTMQTGYTEEVEYNANSAITRMVRHGKGDSGLDLIDDMHYTYSGNRLKAVTDSASALHYAGSFDYKDGAQTSTEYMYDGNGALLYDRNKNVAFISYYKNGMPRRVQFRDGSSTEYLYAADGTKLRKIHKTAVSGITVAWSQWRNLTASQILSADTTLYVGGFEVSSSGLSKYYFENGYLTIDKGAVSSGSVAGDIAYHYLATDHLGSVRTVVGDDGSVEQQNNYFPYGGLFNDVTNSMDVQTRKYNGKELDRMHGLDLYDYSARQYDAALGCFTSMDPLCEKYYHISPYAYCAGNPVKYVDPDGEAVFYYKGDIVHDNGVDDGLIYFVPDRAKNIINAIKNGSEDAISKCILFTLSAKNIQDIGKEILKDDGKGKGKNPSDNPEYFREYGGYLDNGIVVPCKPGAVTDPTRSEQATISLPDGVSTFHTHPSGWTTSYETRDNTNASQSLGIGAESVERYFEQTPSTIDNQRFLKNTLVHYVFGRRSGKTYICQNKNNISVQVATIPTSKFFKLR